MSVQFNEEDLSIIRAILSNQLDIYDESLLAESDDSGYPWWIGSETVGGMKKRINELITKIDAYGARIQT